MKTRLFCILLLLSATMTLSAAATTRFQYGDLWYKITNSSRHTVGVTYQTSGSDNYVGLYSIDIPASVTYNGQDYSVTSIEMYAFKGCSSLTSITIPNSVTSIEDGAFQKCSSLTSITIPNSVTRIGSSAFRNCSSLTSITIPGNVTDFESLAFAGCSGLTSVVILDGVTSIGGGAFQECSSLTSIAIPNSVTSIGNGIFSGCSSLTSITIPNNVKSIESSAFKDCSSLTSISIPDNVTRIRSSAFDGCRGLTSITLSDSITNIGSEAFRNCSSLTSITIPGSVPSIESSVFQGCSGLVSITIPNNVTSIGSSAFQGCSGLVSITIPNNVTSIGSSAFQGCSGLTAINLSNRIRSISASAFSGCSSLTSITIPNSVTNIGGAAFKNCSSLTSIILPNEIRNISASAFSGCSSLVSIAIPDGVTSIEASTFSGCSSLASITIAGSVTNIESSAFSGCSSLASITIPGSVTNIKGSAFSDCSGLTSVVILDGVTSLGNGIFSGCSSLTSITIPNSVTSIGVGAFKKCSSLASVTLPDSVTSIEDETFQDCSDLTSITIPSSVKSLGYWAFNGCSSLTSIIIPGSIHTLGNAAFYGCSNLTSVIILDGVKSIDGSAFYNCSSLASITIPKSVTSIGYQTFYNCAKLTSIAIPDSVMSIGESAFFNCNSLASITIPEAVTSIGVSAFRGCRDLKSVVWNAKRCRSQFSGNISYKAPFGGCYITTFVFGDEVDSIPACLCSGSTIASLTIGKNVTNIGDGAIHGCNPQSIVWNAKHYGNVFALPNRGYVTTFTFGDEVEYIPSHLCEGMKKLAAVTIPSSVTQIGDSAFLNCSNTEFTFTSDTPPQCGTNSFGADRGKFLIPCWSEEKYRAALGDHDFVEPESEYQLSVQSGDSNAGSASIEKEPTCRNTGIVGAAANYGYHFAQWRDGNTDNPRTVTITGDTTFTAEFAKNQYSVSTSVNNGDWGTAKGDTSAFYLDSVTLSATANYGYHFAYWQDTNGILVSTDNPAKMEVIRDTTYTAVFEKNTYSITAQPANPEQGQVTAPASGQYMDYVAMEAYSNYGYYFSRWSDGNYDNPRFVMLTCDTTFTAEFARNQYYVHTIVNNDDWGSSVESNPFPLYLDTITLSATANYGYHFTYWQDEYGTPISTDNPLKIVVIESTVYTAVFERNTYSITVQSANPEQGYVTAPTDAQYLDEVFMEAIPSYGYHFVQWSDSDTNNPRRFILTGDTAFTAEFAISRSGQCGDYLYWQYDNRTLTISGTGSTYDYNIGNSPWLLFCDSIENVVVESGCTNINNRVFYGLSCAEKVELPNTLISIGTDAFSGCSKLSSIYLPATLTTIGADAFAGCRKLYDIYCYAAEPPVADNSSFVNYNVNLYVPCDNLRDYQMDAVFGSFKYIQCMGAENTNTNDSITITPSTNDAVFIWRADETADTYTLQITKDDEVFCTLVFNANGQLRSIAFAPSRNGHPAPRAAEQTAAGFRFTVTGLSQKTHYAFEMKVKDKDDQLLKAYTGEFDTTADTPLATDNVCSEQDTVRKVMHNGQLLIIRGGKTYTATGVEVK